MFDLIQRNVNIVIVIVIVIAILIVIVIVVILNVVTSISTLTLHCFRYSSRIISEWRELDKRHKTRNACILHSRFYDAVFGILCDAGCWMLVEMLLVRTASHNQNMVQLQDSASKTWQQLRSKEIQRANKQKWCWMMLYDAVWCCTIKIIRLHFGSQRTKFSIVQRKREKSLPSEGCCCQWWM